MPSRHGDSLGNLSITDASNDLFNNGFVFLHEPVIDEFDVGTLASIAKSLAYSREALDADDSFSYAFPNLQQALVEPTNPTLRTLQKVEDIVQQIGEEVEDPTLSTWMSNVVSYNRMFPGEGTNFHRDSTLGLGVTVILGLEGSAQSVASAITSTQRPPFIQERELGPNQAVIYLANPSDPATPDDLYNASRPYHMAYNRQDTVRYALKLNQTVEASEVTDIRPGID